MNMLCTALCFSTKGLRTELCMYAHLISRQTWGKQLISGPIADKQAKLTCFLHVLDIFFHSSALPQVGGVLSSHKLELHQTWTLSTQMHCENPTRVHWKADSSIWVGSCTVIQYGRFKAFVYCLVHYLGFGGECMCLCVCACVRELWRR